MCLRGRLRGYRDAAQLERYPEALEVLVQDNYIRKVPIDPFTKSADTWELVFEEAASAGATVWRPSRLVSLTPGDRPEAEIVVDGKVFEVKEPVRPAGGGRANGRSASGSRSRRQSTGAPGARRRRLLRSEPVARPATGSGLATRRAAGQRCVTVLTLV